jgi:hypothetical protein
MKWKNPFLLILVAFLALSSCNQSEKLLSEELVLTEHALGIAPSGLAVETRATPDIKITCGGTCEAGEHPFDPSERSCAAMLYDGGAGTIECPCNDCVMRFSQISAGEASRYLSPSSDYVKYFNEHLIAKFGTAKVLLYSVEIKKYEATEVVWFIYKELGGAEESSVMYVAKLDESGLRAGPVIEVDCSGGCDNPGETCRERYILSTGDVECTCQGSCSMKITEKN